MLVVRQADFHSADEGSNPSRFTKFNGSEALAHYLVYKITNLVNGKIYIGAHKTKDINDGYMRFW